jgi:hypothetical protein
MNSGNPFIYIEDFNARLDNCMKIIRGRILWITILACCQIFDASIGQTLWKEITLPASNQQYKFIDFADSLEGWVFSESGEYSMTADGGVHWRKDTLSIPGKVLQVKAFPESRCWVVSSNSYGVMANIFTTSNGKDWHEIALPESSSAYMRGSAGFSTATAVWFPTYNGLYVSRDTGNSWAKTRPTYGSMANIEFADSLTGYAAFVADGAGGELYGRTLKTTDGGAHWDSIPHDNLVSYDVIRYYSPSFGWLFSHWNQIDGGPIYYYLQGTFDGGHTLFNVSMPLFGAGVPIYIRTFILGCLKYPDGREFLLTNRSFLKQSAQDNTRYTISSDASGLAIVAFESFPMRYNWILTSDNRLFQSIGIPTGIYNNDRIRPTQFLLAQNYPNPFNPSTAIRFSITERSRVNLTIFNLLGQQVAELANEEMNSGNFERTWNANVASGLYFYRLEAVSVSNPGKRFVDVKKMVLVR